MSLLVEAAGQIVEVKDPGRYNLLTRMPAGCFVQVPDHYANWWHNGCGAKRCHMTIDILARKYYRCDHSRTGLPLGSRPNAEMYDHT